MGLVPTDQDPGPRVGAGLVFINVAPDKLEAAPLWLVQAFSRAERGRVEGTSGAGRPFPEPGLGASDLPLRQLPGGWDRAAGTWGRGG